MDELQKPKEKVILVGLGKEYSFDPETDSDDPFEELSLLVDTAGAEVVGIVTQLRNEIVPQYYIGKGKAEELKEEVERTEASTAIFDNDLTPAQLANLEKLLEIKVLDRTGIILDIFALRARTREAKTQVELAQLKYLLTRLTRHWTHLSRQQGGIGMRGPGETQLETDRRSIRQRISHLDAILKKIERRRETGRKKRQDCFKVALVGYTNAGKSSLINVLSDAGVPVEDKLFKTLDSVTRMVRFDASIDVLISDTVGFIRDLPHDLVASFKSTLEEVREADLLLHVADITNHEWEKQIDVVHGVLAEIEASELNTVMVFNKIDKLPSPGLITAVKSRFPEAVFISCYSEEGLDDLKDAVVAAAMSRMLRMTVMFAPEDSRLLSQVYRFATVHETESEDSSIKLTFSIPRSVAEKLNLTERNLHE